MDTQAISDPANPTTKPGFLTSEFVITVLSILAVAIPVVLEKLPPGGMAAAVLGAIGVIAATYTAGRSAVKSTSIRGAAIVASNVAAASATASVSPKP